MSNLTTTNIDRLAALTTRHHAMQGLLALTENLYDPEKDTMDTIVEIHVVLRETEREFASIWSSCLAASDLDNDSDPGTTLTGRMPEWIVNYERSFKYLRAIAARNKDLA